MCAGLGATVKNTCYRAVISKRMVIGNAKGLYKFCEENLKMEAFDENQNVMFKREFILITDVNRSRPETDV